MIRTFDDASLQLSKARAVLACAVWRADAACAVSLVSGAPDHKVRAQGGSVRMRGALRRADDAAA